MKFDTVMFVFCYCFLKISDVVGDTDPLREILTCECWIPYS